MKNFILSLVFLIAWSSVAFSSDSEKQKLKPNVDEDYVIVYQDDWGSGHRIVE